MKLEASQMSLNALVSSSPHGFSIPDFQRNYSWGDAQLDQFWNDLTALVDRKFPDHFLGPVVLLESSGRKPVIDGQQRLTTIVILASVIRDKFVNDFNDADYSVDGTKQVYSHLLNSIIFLSDLTTPLLQSNYQIKSILDSYIIKNPNSDSRKHFGDKKSKMTSSEKRASKNLVNAHEVMTQKLNLWLSDFSEVAESQLIRMHELVLCLKEKVQFLTILVGNEEDAFTIFETLNERGLKLSPADLIKSYILRKIVEENPNVNRDEIIETWDQIIEALEDFDVTNFLRHYLLVKHEGAVQKKVIFKKVKSEVEPEDETPPLSPRKVLENIKFAALNYSQLLVNPNTIIENATVEVSLKKLNMISDNHRIFLLKVLQEGYEDEDLIFAIRSVEKIVFRWLICGLNAQVLENTLQTAAHMVRRADRPSLELACKNLITASPSDEEFRNAIINKSVRDTRLQAYAYRNICLGMTGVEVTTNKKDVSVEHIAPQKPQTEIWYKQIAKKDLEPSDSDSVSTYEDFVYKWGNITILEQKLNSSVGNSVWETKISGNEKYDGYTSSHIASTADLVQLKEWNSDLILKRTQWFADAAVLFWSKELPQATVPKIPRFSAK
jgi:uncharacterized protein with ParB-like and HNH nuclease domain